MLKTLIRKQLLEIFRNWFIDKKTGKARQKKAIAFSCLMFVLMFAALGVMFFEIAGSLGSAILGNGFNWLYFAIEGLIAMALGVFGSVFNTYAAVYQPKDNEMLMSLPIPEGTLLLARLSGVYVTSLMYSAWVWIPAMIAYWVRVPCGAANVVFPVLLTFVIALFVSVLSCALGWVVALVASKTKGKSFLTVALSLVIVVAYYVVYFKIMNSLTEIISHLDEVSEKFGSWLHYSCLLGKAADGDALSLLLTAVITAALAAVCFCILSRSFTKLALQKGSTAKVSKGPADDTAMPLRKALLRRELRHFASVPTWMLNGGFGLLLMPVLAVVLIVKCGSIRQLMASLAPELPILCKAVPALAAAAVCMIVCGNAILAVSVSIEGKSLWQLQSLPIGAREVLRAKERMGMLLNTVPALLLVAVCAAVVRMTWYEAVLVFAAVCLCIAAVSDFGLFLNLKMPDFNWTNEASLTKQGMPVIIHIFGGWIFCILLGLGGVWLCKFAAAWTVLCAYILLFAVLFGVLHRWLRSRGAEIFGSL